MGLEAFGKFVNRVKSGLAGKDSEETLSKNTDQVQALVNDSLKTTDNSESKEEALAKRNRQVVKSFFEGLNPDASHEVSQDFFIPGIGNVKKGDSLIIDEIDYEKRVITYSMGSNVDTKGEMKLSVFYSNYAQYFEKLRPIIEEVENKYPIQK